MFKQPKSKLCLRRIDGLRGFSVLHLSITSSGPCFIYFVSQGCLQVQERFLRDSLEVLFATSSQHSLIRETLPSFTRRCGTLEITLQDLLSLKHFIGVAGLRHCPPQPLIEPAQKCAPPCVCGLQHMASIGTIHSKPCLLSLLREALHIICAVIPRVNN